jgi:hypothetical protein
MVRFEVTIVELRRWRSMMISCRARRWPRPGGILGSAPRVLNEYGLVRQLTAGDSHGVLLPFDSSRTRPPKAQTPAPDPRLDVISAPASILHGDNRRHLRQLRAASRAVNMR